MLAELNDMDLVVPPRYRKRNHIAIPRRGPRASTSHEHVKSGSRLERVLALYQNEGLLVGEAKILGDLWVYFRNREYDGSLEDLATRRGRALDAMDKQVIAVASSFDQYDRVSLRGVEFRSETYTRTNARADMTGVMFPVVNDAGNQEVWYGRIIHILRHRLTPASPVRVIFEVEWYDRTGALWGGRMPQVRTNPGSYRNKHHRFEFASRAYCQNVSFLPRDLRNPSSQDLVAVYVGHHSRPLDV